jgi:hypothetical protein
MRSRPRRLPLEDFAQDQHGPLARRQVLEGRDEGKSDRLAQLADDRRVALGDRASVGDRLDPAFLGQRGAQGVVGGGPGRGPWAGRALAP